MNKPLISIIIPSIRPQNLESIYNSISLSTKRSFELIVIGPYVDVPKLQQAKNIKFIKDFGSPVRCSQIGACLAEGELIMHSADDALFLPDSLDKNIDLLFSMGDDIKNVVVAKYFEGQGWNNNKPLQPDSYFQTGGSTWTKTSSVPESWWLFNVAIMHRLWFETLGGWDCSYEGTFYSHVDLAIRSQFIGSNVKMSDFPILDCDHDQKDHKVIEHVQTYIDKLSYFKEYDNTSWMIGDQSVDINNWKKSSSIWDKRFK